MARLWWTLDPSKFHLKQLAHGGRNEVLFATLGFVVGSAIFAYKRQQKYYRRYVNDQSLWNRTIGSNGKAFNVPRNIV
ncbi:hypothetical protein IMG5_191240 [Ichthyophthirius multifiliis]|uniref:Uncharacterized protein n=1 Tax=Ichthyophthirius multifiliis TaxID=5932 RepID=G0R4C9_ICHMU|nr:hypothetical protein IMG5_191240 [Ichthyophthirius multifiliis]EGR27679.1 hypothetical protein IMG5_191240 [Ichthyophthirius multifiliis]|eukprot:XP_004025131.1 hypothetical protein IMG5_191240 [Ichthyophthirius multifiliis]